MFATDTTILNTQSHQLVSIPLSKEAMNMTNTVVNADSYDFRRAREIQEAAEMRSRIGAWLTSVACELGARIQPRESDSAAGTSQVQVSLDMTIASGVEIWMLANGYGYRDRVLVGTRVYERDSEGAVVCHKDAPNAITFALSRAPVAVAKGIKRRLIPAAEAYRQDVLRAVQRRNEYLDDRRRFHDTIAQRVCALNRPRRQLDVQYFDADTVILKIEADATLVGEILTLLENRKGVV